MTETLETLDNINLNYMKDIFKPKVNSKRRPNDITMQCFKTTECGAQSLNSLGCKIWKHHTPNIKSETSSQGFKKYIETLDINVVAMSV